MILQFQHHIYGALTFLTFLQVEGYRISCGDLVLEATDVHMVFIVGTFFFNEAEAFIDVVKFYSSFHNGQS